MDRIVALIDPENAASARVAMKVGLRYERDTVRPDGKTMQVFAMSKTDFESMLAKEQAADNNEA